MEGVDELIGVQSALWTPAVAVSIDQAEYCPKGILFREKNLG